MKRRSSPEGTTLNVAQPPDSSEARSAGDNESAAEWRTHRRRCLTALIVHAEETEWETVAVRCGEDL